MSRRDNLRQQAKQAVRTSIYDTIAINLLNEVKAWRDSDGNEGFPEPLRERIDVLLLATEVRRQEEARLNRIGREP